jgi:hypothetical protein
VIGRLRVGCLCSLLVAATLRPVAAARAQVVSQFFRPAPATPAARNDNSEPGVSADGRGHVLRRRERRRVHAGRGALPAPSPGSTSGARSTTAAATAGWPRPSTRSTGCRGRAVTTWTSAPGDTGMPPAITTCTRSPPTSRRRCSRSARTAARAGACRRRARCFFKASAAYATFGDLAAEQATPQHRKPRRKRARHRRRRHATRQAVFHRLGPVAV